MKSFIRVVELWIPDEKCAALEYGGGLYGQELHEFREISEHGLFAYNEGLPGKAWAAGHPIIMTEFAGTASSFKRSEEAKLFGLACGVGIPVFAGPTLRAVMILLCGGVAKDYAGAIELWHNAANSSHELALVDGYYGSAGTLEFNSRHTSFPRGYGLPGRAWKADRPVIVSDLREGGPFMRAKDAAEVGIDCGLAIPFGSGVDETWVVALLSAQDSPIAHRFEIWKPAASGDELTFETGYCDGMTDLDALFASRGIRKREGSIGAAWATGRPVISADLENDPCIAALAAVESGLKRVIALPVFRDADVEAVVAWYL
jgi:hypothetical protein